MSKQRFAMIVLLVLAYPAIWFFTRHKPIANAAAPQEELISLTEPLPADTATSFTDSLKNYIRNVLYCDIDTLSLKKNTLYVACDPMWPGKETANNGAHAIAASLYAFQAGIRRRAIEQVKVQMLTFEQYQQGHGSYPQTLCFLFDARHLAEETRSGIGDAAKLAAMYSLHTRGLDSLFKAKFGDTIQLDIRNQFYFEYHAVPRLRLTLERSYIARYCTTERRPSYLSPVCDTILKWAHYFELPEGRVKISHAEQHSYGMHVVSGNNGQYMNSYDYIPGGMDTF